MQVRVWQSFSCNNSSSYYMVARFESVDRAAAVAAELEEFFAEHARQGDAMWQEDGDDEPWDVPTNAARELGKKYGFEWSDGLMWGDGGLVNDEPEVYPIGDAVVLYHSYCGGFGPDVPVYLTKAGGKTEGEEDWGRPLLAVTFSIPDSADGKTAAAAVGSYIDQMRECAETEDGWAFQAYGVPPWGSGATDDMEFECGTPFPGWNDGHTVGLVVKVTVPSEWKSIPNFLEKHGITDYRITVDQPGIVARFRAIAAATCRECGAAPLRFIDARTQDAPDDQLACDDCGGMFAVSELVTS